MIERDFETAALRLAAIVQSSDDAIVSKDLDGIINSWNIGAERLFGFTAAEAVGKSIRIIVPADRQSEEDEVLAKIRRGEKIEHFETVRVRKDGTFVPISLTVSPLRNSAGTVIGASKIARDISDRKRAEKALADAEAARADLQSRLVALVAASGSLLASPRLEDVLPAVLKLTRHMVTADAYAVWRLDESAATWSVGAAEGLSEEFARAMIASYEDEKVTAVPFSEPLLAEDVSVLPILSSRRDVLQREGIASMMAVPLTIHGRPSGTLVLYYRQRHQFSEVETQTAKALGNLASAAITTAELYDAQRRIRTRSDFLARAGAVLAGSLDYHDTLTRVAQMAVPEVADWCTVDLAADGGAAARLAIAHVDPRKLEMARQYRERYAEDPSSPYSVARVIETGLPVMLDTVPEELIASSARDAEHLRAIRELCLTSFMIVPLVAHGRTLGAMTFVSAESGRRYGPEDLRLAQEIAFRAALAVDNARAYDETRRANQLKDDFLATLSHELRTPLNAILGYSRMLKSGMLGGDRVSHAFEIVEKNATALTQIVEDVLDVSRIVAGKIRLNVNRVDLSSVVRESVETVQPAADAKGVAIDAALDPDAPPIAGDADRLQQVIWNLLSNAVKFTPRGGRVQVSIQGADSQVEILVADTGAGIAPDFLPHIFERFRQADSRFSREHGGLGLGLAIARHLVEMHGGTIAASSEGLGRGATFRVRLPALAVQPPATGDPRRPAPPSDRRHDKSAVRLDGVHVLVVDDEEVALDMVREILESAGARVTTARSASEALSRLRIASPDVILSDIGMPGVDGLELIAQVREAQNSAYGTVPAAALTAYARSEDRTRALRAGFQMHLAKPIDPGELLEAVQALARR